MRQRWLSTAPWGLTPWDFDQGVCAHAFTAVRRNPKHPSSGCSVGSEKPSFAGFLLSELWQGGLLNLQLSVPLSPPHKQREGLFEGHLIMASGQQASMGILLLWCQRRHDWRTACCPSCGHGKGRRCQGPAGQAVGWTAGSRLAGGGWGRLSWASGK